MDVTASERPHLSPMEIKTRYGLLAHVGKSHPEAPWRGSGGSLPVSAGTGSVTGSCHPHGCVGIRDGQHDGRSRAVSVLFSHWLGWQRVLS
jgi:hypothetical protein